MPSLYPPYVPAVAPPRGRVGSVVGATAAFFVGLTIAAIVAVRFPLAGGVPLCVLAPAWILATGRVERFARLKLATLIVGRALVPCAVLGLIGGGAVATIVMWLYRLNICEAVGEDARKGRYANAIGGTAVVLSTAWMHIHWLGEAYVIEPGPFLCAAIAYTIWNWNFVAGNFSPAVAMLHVATLAAPLFCGLAGGNMGFWLITRATSLTVSVVLLGAIPKQLEQWLDHEQHLRWRSVLLAPKTQAALSALTVAFAVASVVIPRLHTP
jgi:hypothetical protein